MATGASSVFVRDLERRHTDETNELVARLTAAECECARMEAAHASLKTSYETISEKLGEAIKLNKMLNDDNEQVESLLELSNLLKVENGELRDLVASQAAELAKREADALAIEQRLAASVKREADDARLIESMRADLRERHVVCQQKISELSGDGVRLRERVQAAEAECERQRERIEHLSALVDKYEEEKRAFNFKEFVAIKRELHSLKEERERQFVAANARQQQQQQQPTSALSNTPPLPPIKPLKKNLFTFFNGNNKS